MNMSTLLLTLCLICTPQTAEASHVSEECFESVPQLRLVHKTEHAYRHKTPDGTCWHIGKRNHSENFTSTKHLPPKIGKTTSKASVWGANAKPPYMYEYLQDKADMYTEIYRIYHPMESHSWYPAGR